MVWKKYQWVRSLEWWHSRHQGTKSSLFTFILTEMISIYVSCYDVLFLEHRTAGLLGENVA